MRIRVKLKTTLLIFTFLVQATAQAALCSNELDDHFEGLPSWLNQESDLKGFDKSCVMHSMNAFSGWAQSMGFEEDGKKGVFINCSEEANDDYRRSSIPQCQTDAYINTTLNSYMNIADCLEVDFESLYPIIAAESGFYHNAFSPTGKDFGFGQVTDPAIHDVNLSWYRFLDEMKDSTKKSCQNIISFIEENDLRPVDENYHCELTRAPDNPLLNVIYTGMHYRLITSYMDGYSQRTHLKSRLENYLGKNYSLSVYHKIRDVLTILSYNLGHDGTVMAFEEFLLERNWYLNKTLLEKKELSTEMAKVNFALMELPTEDLKAKKAKLLNEMAQINSRLDWVRSPDRFNGDDSTPGSFGEYIVEKKISYYLKILRRRVNYISKKDRAGVCPTESIFHIKD
jgi:hypothetical protein